MANRPGAIEKAEKYFRGLKAKLKKLPKAKPWIPAEKIEEVEKSLENAEKWLTTK